MISTKKMFFSILGLAEFEDFHRIVGKSKMEQKDVI